MTFDEGDTAKSHTPDHLGLHLIEAGKPKKCPQSFKAITMAGVTRVIGFLGGISRKQRKFAHRLSNVCITEGVIPGSLTAVRRS